MSKVPNSKKVMNKNWLTFKPSWIASSLYFSLVIAWVFYNLIVTTPIRGERMTKISMLSKLKENLFYRRKYERNKSRRKRLYLVQNTLHMHIEGDKSG